MTEQIFMLLGGICYKHSAVLLHDPVNFLIITLPGGLMNACAGAGFKVEVIFHCEELSIARGKESRYDSSEYYANIRQLASLRAMNKHCDTELFMNRILPSLCDTVERHCADSHRLTTISGLTLFRIEKATRPQHLIYHPRILVVTQGSKRVQLGRSSFWLNPKKILVVTVDVPVATQIYTATNGMPHLAFTLDLDLSVLAEVLQQVPTKPSGSCSFPGIAATATTFNLLEPFMRLLRLLDQPNDIEFVAPLIIKEIYFRLIQSNLGDVLTQFSLNQAHVLQIRQVTNWIKLHYEHPMSIEMLANMANMSISTFHRHFKNLTLMSPIQYRTQIRLQEARRILLSEGERAGAVGVRVGYESQSQFTRDYKRMFGAPPVTDTTRLVTHR